MRNLLLTLAVLAVAALAAGLWLRWRGAEPAAASSLEPWGPAVTRPEAQPAAPSHGDEPEALVPSLAEGTEPELEPQMNAAAEALPHGDPELAAHQAPTRLFGRITVDGELVPAHILAHRVEGKGTAQGDADERGAYELLLPRPGLWSLSIRAEETVDVHLHARVVGPREQRLDVEIPLGAIEGHVYGPDGPLSGLEVDLSGRRQDAWSSYLKVRTDESGRYSIDRLPAGTWTVRAGHGTGETSPYTWAEVPDVVVAPGERVGGVDLHLLAGGIVAGRVLASDGSPASGADLQVRRPSGEAVLFGDGMADGEGRFAIGGLEPGAYILAAFHGQHESGEIAIAVEPLQEQQVVLRTAPGTIVRILVQDPLGSPQPTCRRSDGIDFSNWAASDVRCGIPEHCLGPLLPGTYTFAVDRGDLVPPSSQTVILAGEREILLVL